MTDKPTVGRIVHFYDKDIPMTAHNSQGHGPYPAMVIQTFEGPYVNLRVWAYDKAWIEGSVSQYDPDAANPLSRYWVWPPRV